MRCHLGPRGKKPSLEVALGCLRIQAEVQGCVAWVEAAAICEGRAAQLQWCPCTQDHVSSCAAHVPKEKHDFQ